MNLDPETNETRLERTAGIVAAYVSNNHVPREELPDLIRKIYDAFAMPGAVAVAPVVPIPDLVPAVSIKKSVTADYLICLEDGKSFRSLKRHLMTDYGLTPDAYRHKWGLPADYPMVAPSYAAKRSELAKAIGLGRKARQPED